MAQPSDPGQNPSDVHAHLTILQGVISRMASNSQSCKTWCVTAVAAIFIVSINTMTDGVALIALVPILLLGWLDIYYLGLERAFRNSYMTFVAAVKRGEDVGESIYEVSPTWNDSTTTWACFKSKSIGPFYSALSLVAGVVAIVIAFTGD